MHRLHRVLTGFALAFIACEKAEKPATSTTAQPATEAPATKPADTPAVELPKIEGPVARVNAVDIPSDKFLREYKTTLERYAQARHDVKPELRERLKDNIVRRLIDAVLITQQAKKMSIEVTDAEFAEKWADHKKRYGSEEAFQSFLQRAGTTADDVQEQYRLNLLREKVFAKISDDVQVDPKEIKDFYEENKERYNEPEQVRASHILIRVDPQASAEQKKEKKKLADDILKKAKKKGADFAALAKEHGEDPTRGRGGDLGFFAKGRMVKPFEDAVWKLKVDQLSNIVETNFGYHIIKKTGHKEAHQKTFDEVKEQIDRSVRARKRNQAIRDALQKWKDESKIEILVQGDPAVIEAGRKEAEAQQPQIQLKPAEGALPIQPGKPPVVIDTPIKGNQ